MKTNKKGATLAVVAQAMVLIFLIFLITSTLVVLNVVSITRKQTFLITKAYVTQLKYDIEYYTFDEFVEEYTTNKGYVETENSDTSSGIAEIENDELNYLVNVKLDSLSPENGDKMNLTVKFNKTKIVLIADYKYNSTTTKYELASWKFQI